MGPVRQNINLSPVPSNRPFFPAQVQSSKPTDDASSRPLPLPSKAGTSASAVTIPIKPLVDKMSKPAAFTKPSATVTPTLKSTGMTASSTKPTVLTTTSTKTVSTSTMVPTTQQFKNVEKGEASSTTCSPKPDSVLSETVTTSVNSSTPSQDTDSDPNVSSTTGLNSKKKVDINKDIKTIKKEFDSLTSFKEKKEVGEELFAPSATIIQQIKPKYNKIEKKPQSSSKYNDIFSMNDVKKSKDKLVKDRASSGKDAKKDKIKVKQRFQTNDLKDFLAADSKQTIKRAVVTDKKPESKEKVETKRRLSVNSENDELEPKAKIPKLKSDSDGESEAKKPKSESMKPMGRIPKIEKKEDKRERTESVKSHDGSTDKDKERKRKKEDDERRKHHAEQMRKRKKMEGSSNSDGSDDSSDGDERKFSIFDEPVFDENNPVYFSMYDKVKARRSCVKAKEEEEQKRQEEALKKFAKLKEQRAKREGKKQSVDSDDDSMSGDDEMTKLAKEEMKLKKKQSFIDSSSDSDDDSDEGQKPLISKSLSKIGLDSSDSDNNRGQNVEGASIHSQSNKKHSSYLETDSEHEGSDVKVKIPKSIKTESDHSDTSKDALLKKKIKTSTSDTDSDLEECKTNALSLLAKTKTKPKEKSIKTEPLTSDSEDEKPDMSKFNIKKENKNEQKHPNKATDVKNKPIVAKKKKKTIFEKKKKKKKKKK